MSSFATECVPRKSDAAQRFYYRFLFLVNFRSPAMCVQICPLDTTLFPPRFLLGLSFQPKNGEKYIIPLMSSMPACAPAPGSLTLLARLTARSFSGAPPFRRPTSSPISPLSLGSAHLEWSLILCRLGLMRLNTVLVPLMTFDIHDHYCKRL